MINVLYITHESQDVLGSTHSLVNMMHSIKTEVHPIVIFPKKGKVFDYLTKLGYVCYIVPFKLNIAPKKYKWLKFIPRKIVDSIFNAKANYEISKIVKKEHIQLVHSNSSVFTIGYDIAKRNRLKHVWHIREFQDLDFNFNPFTGWKKLRRMIHESDAIIAITKAIANHFTDSTEENCFIIRDAVRSVKEACCIPIKEKYILFLGHVTHNKGAEVALNIFIEFWKMHQDYMLYYIGPVSDEYKDHLSNIIKGSCIKKDSVFFLGYRENVKDYLMNASALLMCSQNEAQGRVTIEAMFYGCPVLGYKSGGTKEIIHDGLTGFLFTDINEAVYKLNYIVQNTNNDIALNAINYVKENFSEEKYGHKILSIYNSLLNV